VGIAATPGVDFDHTRGNRFILNAAVERLP